MSDDAFLNQPSSQPVVDDNNQTLGVNDVSQPQSSSAQPLVSVSAEAKEAGGGAFKEAEPKVVEKKEFVVPKEVKPWVKVEKKEEITLPQPIKDEYGQILIKSAQPNPAKIFLPLTQEQTKLALKKRIVDSVRWLAEWCLRLIKMFPKRTSYASPKSKVQSTKS